MKKINPNNSKTLYVGGIFEVDKASGVTPTPTALSGTSPKSDNENFEFAFRF